MIETTAAVLDHLRSRVLRYTLKIEPLRPVFYTRSQRLLVMFSVACVLMLALSTLYPLWILLAGPLIYGVPHIFSSLRYFHYAVSETHSKSSRQRSFAFAVLGLILVSVFAYRLFITANYFGSNYFGVAPQLSEWKGSTFVELAALALTFLAGAAIYRKSFRNILKGLMLLVPFCIVFCRFPLWTVGALVLIHNFVAFAYWIIAAQTRQEKRVAWFATAVTFAVTCLIFLGSFDWAYRFIEPSRILDFANLSITDTGQLIAPWSTKESLWLHACVAFAFGQSLHYFVWLKAIPDQYHYHEVPTSFRQSLGLLQRDFGRAAATLLIILGAGSVMIWSFMKFQDARLIYFCLASYHGYLEIAGLGLVNSRATSSLRVQNSACS